MSNQPRPLDAALAQVLLTALTVRNVPRAGPLTFRSAHDMFRASCCYRELSLQQLWRRHCPRELSVVRLAPHDGVVVGRMPILTGRYLVSSPCRRHGRHEQLHRDGLRRSRHGCFLVQHLFAHGQRHEARGVSRGRQPSHSLIPKPILLATPPLPLSYSHE